MENKNYWTYEKSREDAKNFYKNIFARFSPALNDYIYFTARGFNHIIFIGSRRKRKESAQSFLKQWMIALALVSNKKPR
jgi:hypothetical protein